MTDTNLYQNIGNDLNLGKLTQINSIQTLWSGYGEIVRLKFESKSVIVKHVKLPNSTNHPRGWNTNLSHQRKINSYKVEVNWYENFSKTIDKNCYIPKGLKTFQTKDEWLIVMEDLETSGFVKTSINANEEQIISCLKWLANFHAKYMNEKSDLLWDIGTYWHLDTRPDELKVLEDKQLKNYAKRLDEVLNSCKYQTIVHGDAKLANFCFSSDDKLCAAVDFQYIGHGCGMKDVIYFISSAIEPESCEQSEEWLLNVYFIELKKAIKIYQSSLNFEEIEEEYRFMYDFAWADFQRFIKGWSPNHFKINDYSEMITKRALNHFSNEDIY
jgi:hypothetical protein